MLIRPRYFAKLLRTTGVPVLLMLSCTAAALEQFRLAFGQLEGGAWRLGEASLQVDLSDPQNPRLQVDIDSATIAGERLDRIRLDCTRFDLRVNQVDCSKGTLGFASARLSASAVPVTFRYRFASKRLDVGIRKLALAGGHVDLALQYDAQAWKLGMHIRGAALADIARLLAEFSPAIAALNYQGRVSGSLDLHGGAAGFAKADWQLQTQQAGYSNAAGDQAAEDLQLSSRGTASFRPRRGWRVQADVQAGGGIVYSDPVYLEFSEQQALSMAVDLQWRPHSGDLLIDNLQIEQPQVLSATLEAHLRPAAEEPLRALRADIRHGQLPGLYSSWLQPWLAGTALGDLDTQGALRGQLEMNAGSARSLDLHLNDISLSERKGQFGIGKLNGRLRWHSEGPSQANTLSWQSGNLYRLQFGAADVLLEVGPASAALQAPLALPLFDGELRVEEFNLALQAGRVNWLLDGMLVPVSMRTLSQAFDWPPFSGKLSGMFPKVRYQQGELTLGGVLLVQAFDGDITLRNLRVQEPLGLVPRLWVDARLDHLDLKPLTEAFSFGRIEGQLQGRVDGLYMEAWQPVAFDAEFRTPPGDRSRHRISQRAVDTISDLGGAGMAGALSRSFLRFLEDFPYKAIGIRCRLENAVCRMGGVADAQNGYYLVQGTLLPPRLDVVGYAEEVDWPSLLGRLKAATRGGAPALE